MKIWPVTTVTWSRFHLGKYPWSLPSLSATALSERLVSIVTSAAWFWGSAYCRSCCDTSVARSAVLMQTASPSLSSVPWFGLSPGLRAITHNSHQSTRYFYRSRYYLPASEPTTCYIVSISQNATCWKRNTLSTTQDSLDQWVSLAKYLASLLQITQEPGTLLTDRGCSLTLVLVQPLTSNGLGQKDKK